MSLRITLLKLAAVVSDEAERNPDFAHRLKGILQSSMPDESPSQTSNKSKIRRPGRRRTPAVLDPIELAAHGESDLRSALEKLTLDQLKDIVADYGMDQEKLVMKWKKPGRVIERIVEKSVIRAHKGDAFRS